MAQSSLSIFPGVDDVRFATESRQCGYARVEVDVSHQSSHSRFAAGRGSPVGSPQTP